MDPEYGCEHLRKLLEKNDKSAAKFYHYLLCVHRTRSLKPKALSTESSRSRGFALLKPSYACLQCKAICSRGELDEHAQEHGHKFFADSRSGSIYCRSCQDFVYDVNLERYLTSPVLAKKRDHEDIDEDDTAIIASNASKRVCGREGMRGLYNLGQTCYMNVILQTLLHDGLLTTYFLGNGHKVYECTDEHCVSCALYETFAEFNNDENTGSICSLNVLHAAWVASPDQLGGNQQQDAHEFYQFLVDKLHCATISDPFKKESYDDSDCKCFFHKAFFGKLRSSVTCNNCGNVTKKDDPIMDLSLAFQAQKHPENDSVAAAKAAQTRTLTGCLDSFTAPERLTYSCGRCGGVPQQATKQLQIGRLPFILCMQLKRFERTPTTTEKMQGKIDFPLSLNMVAYTTRPHSHNSAQYMYDLSSAIVHTGTTVDSGHYYAYCRQDEQWFLFNDDKVLQVSVADVLNANAYLLFYTVRSLSGPCETDVSSYRDLWRYLSS